MLQLTSIRFNQYYLSGKLYTSFLQEQLDDVFQKDTTSHLTMQKLIDEPVREVYRVIQL